MARTLEPRAAAPWRRLEVVRSLTDAGVPVGVLVAPVIPFINDESLEHILHEAKAAGEKASAIQGTHVCTFAWIENGNDRSRPTPALTRAG